MAKVSSTTIHVQGCARTFRHCFVVKRLSKEEGETNMFDDYTTGHSPFNYIIRAISVPSMLCLFSLAAG